MSFEATRTVWSCSKQTGSHKLVLLCIAYHQNTETGDAWPSIARLGQMCGLQRRQVFDILNDLVLAGEVERISGRSAGKVNRYAVKLSPAEGVHPGAPPGAAHRTPASAANRTPPVRSTAPKSLLKEDQEPGEEEMGHLGAALGIGDLVVDGVTSEAAARLMARVRSTGKRFITRSEWASFKAEVSRARGWSIAEAVEEIGPGLACRVLHEFKAGFLCSRSNTLVAAGSAEAVPGFGSWDAERTPAGSLLDQHLRRQAQDI